MATQVELLAKIEAFEIDGLEAPDLTFAARLAREQGWTVALAWRAIREYKRFVYLALTADHIACPSEQVDAVWHQHLTYTRSYWKRFCGDVLGRPLHHEPTRGGPDEHEKHHALYEATLVSYRSAFGEEPPADLWPAVDVRFGDDLRHTVVNVKQNWVIPKAWVRRAALTTVAAFAFGFAAIGCGNGLNPLTLVDVEYLVFLVPLLVAALVVGLIVRRANLGQGLNTDEPLPALNWQETAYLAGGLRRLTTATIARLIETGMAKVSTDETIIEPTGIVPGILSPIERQILKTLPLKKSETNELATLVKNVDNMVAKKLEESGYTFTSGHANQIGCISAIPLFGVMILFGVSRLGFGLANDKPVGYLLGILVFSLVVTIVLAGSRPLRTRKGQQLLKAIQSQHQSFKKAPKGTNLEQAALAVAIFGTAALAGSQLEALQRWYPKGTSGEAGWSGGCGGGGGGCGGGGCGGGCGGCG